MCNALNFNFSALWLKNSENDVLAICYEEENIQRQIGGPVWGSWFAQAIIVFGNRSRRGTQLHASFAKDYRATAVTGHGPPSRLGKNTFFAWISRYANWRRR